MKRVTLESSQVTQGWEPAARGTKCLIGWLNCLLGSLKPPPPGRREWVEVYQSPIVHDLINHDCPRKVKVKLLSRVWRFPDPMDCSLPASSIHGIFQARVLEWVAISFSRGSSRPRDWTWSTCIIGRALYRLSHRLYESSWLHEEASSKNTKGLNLKSFQFSKQEQGFPGGLDGKASARNAGDLGSIPGSGRFPREGNGNPLQYSCLENSMDEGAW